MYAENWFEDFPWELASRETGGMCTTIRCLSIALAVARCILRKKSQKIILDMSPALLLSSDVSHGRSASRKISGKPARKYRNICIPFTLSLVDSQKGPHCGFRMMSHCLPLQWLLNSTCFQGLISIEAHACLRERTYRSKRLETVIHS